MSRIGKRPVSIPSGVTAEIANGILSVKGPKGTLTLGLRDEIAYKVEGDSISVIRLSTSVRCMPQKARASLLSLAGSTEMLSPSTV